VPEPSPARSPAAKLRVSAIGKLAGLAVSAALLLWLGREAAAYVPRFAQWVESLGTAGALVFALGYALAVVSFIPGSVLTLAAGAIFGLAKGTALVMFGATLGAAAAFLIARHLARDAVARRLEGDPRFAAIDRAIEAQGRRIVFLLRLSPAFPFSLLNYALGLTRVRLADYLIASLGMLPGTLLYVYSGKVAGELAAVAGAGSARSPAEYALLGVGFLATLLVTLQITRIARRALAESTGARARQMASDH